MLRPFHLAFPVRDIESTRTFYRDVLGATVGREDVRWIDFNFFGHQISAHVTEDRDEDLTNAVDGDRVPVRHFGVVLRWEDWESLASSVAERGVRFLIAPRIRFEGQPGEQGTFFVCDPSGNALEFKTFRDDRSLFATE